MPPGWKGFFVFMYMYMYIYVYHFANDKLNQMTTMDCVFSCCSSCYYWLTTQYEIYGQYYALECKRMQ